VNAVHVADVAVGRRHVSTYPVISLAEHAPTDAEGFCCATG
jgi:hypothetical protein